MASNGGGGANGSDEFESVRSEVSWYFGALVGEVSGEHPVSEATLLTALTKLQVAATRRKSLLRQDTVSHRSATERVVLLHDDHWKTLVRAQQIQPTVAAAAADVHRRLAEAMHAGASDPEHAPFVLLL